MAIDTQTLIIVECDNNNCKNGLHGGRFLLQWNLEKSAKGEQPQPEEVKNILTLVEANGTKHTVCGVECLVEVANTLRSQPKTGLYRVQ